MDVSLTPDEVIKPLWSAYRKTKEYKQQNLTKAIPPHHPLVEDQERLGLKSIYKLFIKELESTKNARWDLKNRSISEWLEEWRGMHKMLFQHILKECGDWRKKDVRFGNPEDVDKYRIPQYIHVSREVSALAEQISSLLKLAHLTNEDKYRTLAQVHYQFTRVHPFADGNGRIARAITDQLAIYLGLPPAMAGYPRHDEKRRENYHKAIRACADDSECVELALWIGGYIEEQLKLIA